jgi:hypothetical protein
VAAVAPLNFLKASETNQVGIVATISRDVIRFSQPLFHAQLSRALPNVRVSD